MLNLLRRKEPTYNSPLSEFMRNASAREKKRAFKRAIEAAIKEQQKVMDEAAHIRAARAANGNGKAHDGE